MARIRVERKVEVTLPGRHVVCLPVWDVAGDCLKPDIRVAEECRFQPVSNV